MTTSTTSTTTGVSGAVGVGDVDIWVERRGEGEDVLLLCGLTDPAAAWQPQLDLLADRYRLTAFDNRGTGRTPLTPGISVEQMADDAAAVLRHFGVEQAHVAGFSGGSRTAQELALRHPHLVRSLVLVSTWAEPDPYLLQVADYLRWLADVAPSERAMLDAFLLWIYTPRAHDDGTVAAIVEQALADPFPMADGTFHAQLDAWMSHRTGDRLRAIDVPTLVIAGGEDVMTRPSHGREVAALIPGAELHVMEGEAHQPFQEVPERFNEIVTEFWRRTG
jgi:pimeloyl-ACP methyl ester carboxylesterase